MDQQRAGMAQEEKVRHKRRSLSRTKVIAHGKRANKIIRDFVIEVICSKNTNSKELTQPEEQKGIAKD